MGYYSDTTRKLMNQIGEPFESRASGGRAVMPDLASLLLALSFMPQAAKGMPAGVPVDPVADSLAMLNDRIVPNPLPVQNYPNPVQVVDRGLIKDSFSGLGGPGLLQAELLKGLLPFLFGARR